MVEKKINIKAILKEWVFNESLEVREEDIDYEVQREVHIFNINDKYILKMTSSEDEIKNNINIANLLLKNGIPVQKVILTQDGKSYYSVNNKYYVLFEKIQGVVLKDYYEGDYISRGIYLGECIAKLHNGLKSITEGLKEDKRPWDNDMIKELDEWVDEEIDKYIPICNLDKEKIESFNEIRKDVNKNFKELYYSLPRQIIHRDISGINMIFKEDKLVGYIDFDLSQINTRLFDICYLCTGALASAFDNKENRDKWTSFSKAIFEGYENIIELTDKEKESIKYMMYSIESIMIAFFARDGYIDLANKNIEMINFISSDL